MKTPSKPIRRGREIYHTAASASRYLDISERSFFYYRKAGIFYTEAVLTPNGKIKMLYRQSMLDKAMRPCDLLEALKISEKYQRS